MKTKTLFYMALTAVMTTLAACSQDDELTDAAPSAALIEFEITDGGFGGAQTRAEEDGMRTKFTAGDACGLYVVRGGSIIADNVKLTASEGENGTIVWAPSTEIGDTAEGDKYFLYYPYNNNMTNYYSLKTSATDDAGFFSGAIYKWRVDLYQGDYSDYTKKDLMTATGTATDDGGKLKVSFSMTHRMALAIIELPKTEYKFTNNGGGAITSYTVPTQVDFTNYKPLRMADGTYRLIVNPNSLSQPKPFTGTANGKTFTIYLKNLSGCSGKFKTFKVAGGADGTPIKKDHTLQVGDYLMKDGNLIGKDATLSDAQKADVAAIVFAVGHNDKDESDYTSTGIGAAKCHGYAVALENATSSNCQWGESGTKLGCFPTGENNYDSPDLDWSGYLYTKKIIEAVEKAGKTLNGKRSDGYPATYYAVESYPKVTAAPANSSGWFLPAVGQLKQVNNSISFTGNVGTSLSGEFWSSSEDSRNPNNCALIINGSYLKKSCDKSPNDYGLVRAVLAF